ncbi:MAG: PstS family phosphate ABC transporter substrate-binding protein [Syntrophaceae bacterium]|nr:PstS family phosphate ABC transporter substrate-binding protein [Syntrophaceae bacterium]
MKKGKSMFVLVLGLTAGIFFGMASSFAASDMIQVKGSDSEVNLVQRLAEVFMKKNPGVNIAVTGGGSGTGIAALINKKTDIANSSRDMSGKEIEAAKQAGVNPIGVAFATDGISVIVHPDNPVKKLTMEQVGKIFKGDIANWKEVGGPDMAVSLYGRQSNSGTYVFFREFVVKADYSRNKKAMNGNAQIVEAVQRDKAGIGYVAVGYVVDVKGNVKPGLQLVAVAKDAQSEAVTPDKMENVMSGKYPISRPLYQFVNGKPSGKLAEFIKFELSPEGQQIVREMGFFPVQDKWMEFNKKQGVI